ncbi:MAG: phenylalanine--tRNA ligase subunit alpha [Patescibacteria group bacterium]|jgi:phenylalanyl-tRNA synthetase alpha chain
MKSLEDIKLRAQKDISAAKDAQQLFNVEKKYLGRKGELTLVLKQVKDLSAEEKRTMGKQANELQKELEQLLSVQRRVLAEGSGAAADLSLPALKQEKGSVHPLMAMQQRIEDIFLQMGYEILYGPEIEKAKYNFDLLNIPEKHPSRDVWDTFYVSAPAPSGSGGQGAAKKSGPETPLLRTHISPMQIRVMEERKPPIRFISPGRVFRHEATDATHEANYFYNEGLVIEKGISFGDMLGTLDVFFKALFGDDVETRAQPSFFPFVEPGAEVLMKGSKGWMEMLGCGMVHPKVLKNMGVDPKEYSGFAFGMGIDRLMMYYNDVRDIRSSYQGDLRFLKQF